MKKGLLLIFAFISLHSLAQSVWIKDNAMWHYKYINFGTPGSGYIKIWDDGDVVIHNKVCSNLKAQRHHFMNWGPQQEMTEFVSSYIEAAVYVSNDTVFYWDQDHFSVLYDFSAQVNDHWLLQTGADTTINSCNDTSMAVVHAVGTINLDGQNYTELVLGASNGSGVYLAGRANARFGSSQAYLLPFPTNCNSTIVEFDAVSLVCFQDDELYYNPTGETCEYYLSVNNRVKITVSVFPNPSVGKFELLSEIPLKKIKVMNVLGAVLKEFDSNLTLTEIDLSEMPQGTYYLNIEDSNGGQTVKPVQLLK
ncbi:hypothetical protein D3C87_431380 [compost metagenome]